MCLVFDEIEIELAGETVHLRPTLRAAARLEKRYGGFSNLIVSISEGKLSVIADVIAHTAGTINTVPEYLETIDGRPIGPEIERVIGALTQLVLKMAGLDDAPKKRADECDVAERITFGVYFETLFHHACGVLGWTPETAWNATPAEINSAYRARMALLQMLFGGSPKEDNGPREHSASEIKDGIAQLRALSLDGATTAP